MKSVTFLAQNAVVAFCMACYACPAEEPVKAVVLQGTFARPADGIANDDLNKAWVNYGAAIGEAISLIQKGLEEAKQSAQKRKDLDRVELLEAAKGLFQGQGTFPAVEFLGADAHAEAARAIRKANAALMEAYDAGIGTLTKAGDAQTARVLRDEQDGLKASLAFPPIPNVAELLFDGQEWKGWGGGWGVEGQVEKHEVVEKEKAVRLTGYKFFIFDKVFNDRCMFEVDVRNRSWQFPKSAAQLGIQNANGACLVRIPARDRNGVVVDGKAEVIHYNHQIQQTIVLAMFDCPPSVDKFKKCRVSWGDGLYSVDIDGRRVVDNKPLPAQLQGGLNVHIGVGDGSADFRNLKITRIIVPNVPGAGNR